MIVSKSEEETPLGADELARLSPDVMQLGPEDVAPDNVLGEGEVVPEPLVVRREVVHGPDHRISEVRVTDSEGTTCVKTVVRGPDHRISEVVERWVLPEEGA